jgi:predicted ATPase/class 3 adenylate cyclase
MAARSDRRSQLPSGSVAFVFTDVEGSTRLFQSLGDAYPPALAAHLEAIETAFAAHDGVVLNTEGDGLFAAFPNAPAALLGCLDAQLATAARPHAMLRSRMGIHVAYAVPVNGDYVSLGVHQAARVTAAGRGGQVLLSGEAVSAVPQPLPGGCVAARLGAYRLKDFDAPAELFDLRHPSLPPTTEPPRVPAVAASGFRLARTSFVGRDTELAQLRDALATHRLVTVIGPGGVGKSRLAVRAAAEADAGRDGRWLVELAAVRPGEGTVAMTVASAVARALGVREQPGVELVEVLATELLERHLLLLLDNCEHVLDEAARLADTLGAHCPHVIVLATSREPLNVPGELRYRIAPLPLPPSGGNWQELLDYDAVRLFVERAHGETHATLDAATLRSAAEICRRLDGLPLALELAAARARQIGVVSVAARLADRFTLLTAPAVGEAAGRHTLLSTVQWSYEMLDAPHRELFQRLAVFPASFDLDAAELVCSDDTIARHDVAPLLADLVDKSLVATQLDAGLPVHSMLETLREFAADRLAERADAPPMRLRHAAWIAGIVHPRPDLASVGEPQVRRLALHIDDALTALAYCVELPEPEVAVRLLYALYRYWARLGAYGEAQWWFTRATSIRGLSARQRQVLGVALARLEAELGDPTRAVALVDTVAATDDLDIDVAFFALTVQGQVHELAEDFAGAVVAAQRLLERAEAEGNLAMQSAAHETLGLALTGSDDLPGALEHTQRAVDLAIAAGDEWRLPVLLYNLHEVVNLLGDRGRAVVMLRQVLAEVREHTGFRMVETAAYHALAELLPLDDPERAACAERAAALESALGSDLVSRTYRSALDVLERASGETAPQGERDMLPG